MDSRRIRMAGVLLGAAAVAAACAGGPEGLMQNPPPPPGWEERLILDRLAKDRAFREDPQSPLLASDREGFRGLDYFPPNPKYRFVGRIHRYPDPERFEIPTTSGEVRPCERYGWVEFELDGRRLCLQVYRLLDNPPDARSLFVPFKDGTSGRETYPAGRYVDLNGDPEGIVELDFNRAYNPSCAYGDPTRFMCPVTPEENRLPVRIEAGERGYREPDATQEVPA